MRSGTLRKGRPVAWCRADGTIERARITELYITDALDRVPTDEAGPGEIVAVAGIPEITIGETLADPDDPRPLPVIHIDEPSLSMTIGINTSPLAGKEGTPMTARLVKNRLDAELVGNVSIRVLPTERPDTWEVQGRGELQLAVLVEMMRREGFELTVGKPQVLTTRDRRRGARAGRPPHRRRARGVPGRRHPAARPAQGADGADRQPRHRLGAPRLPRAGPRPDRVPHRVAHRDARHRRCCTTCSSATSRGPATIRARTRGSLVADRHGPTTGYSLLSLQERGQLFVGPGVEVYEGMIVGENARADDMDVNPTKEKKLTNMRSSTSDDVREADPAPADVAGAGARVHRRGRVRRGDAAVGAPAQGRSSTRPSAAASPSAPRPRLSISISARMLVLSLR